MAITAPLKRASNATDTVTGCNFKVTASASMASIALPGFSIARYSLTGSPNIRQLRVGNQITFAGCVESENDGTFTISALDYDSCTIDVTNEAAIAELTSTGTVDLSLEGHAIATFDAMNALPASLPTQIKKTVGLTAIRLCVGSTKLANRKKLMFQAQDGGGSEKFYIGSSTVTASGATQGLEVSTDTLYEFQDQCDWYIISDTAAQAVVVVEIA